MDNNKWFRSAYEPGENERHQNVQSEVVVNIEIQRNRKTKKMKELSICGMIFHMKSKMLET